MTARAEASRASGVMVAGEGLGSMGLWGPIYRGPGPGDGLGTD